MNLLPALLRPRTDGAARDLRRRRPRALVVLAIAVLLVVAAEVSVRLIEPYLPTPAGWPDTATATKVEQLEREAAQGCTDVVFVGSSMSRDDFVPAVFSRTDPAGRSSYNAALDAASPSLLLRWVRDRVLPSTQPATVVIGVATFDLNDAASLPQAALRSYVEAPFTTDGLASRLEAVLYRRLALVRNRESLREPETVLDAVADRLQGQTADRPSAAGIEGIIAADGHGLSRRDLRFSPADATVERLRRQFLRPFVIGGEQAAALRELVQEIQRAGATPVVHVLPVTDVYVEAHPGGAEDVRAFQRALRSTLAGTGAVLVPAPPTPVGAFADTHHLNGRGADAFSASLPERLRANGVPTAGCGAV